MQRILMFTIGILSEILNVHQRTLRIYEQENVLKTSKRGRKPKIK